ncbi:MAG: hypothetical protein WKF57_12120 [Nakamurella sp.]
MRREPDRGSRVREEDLGETWPEIPEWASVDELAPDVKRDLRGLSKEGAEFVALHLVAAGTLAEVEPELAWRHARAARSKGGRIAVVRETVGLVAYRAGEWAETIAELRAARRMGGGPGHLAVMADSERALGNPEKAIEMSRSTEAAELDDDGKLELTIVVAGARADLGQIDTALVVLEGSGVLEDDADARLLYAYADLLAAAERTEEALDWFMKAHDADEDDETDAAERIAELAAGADDDDDDDDDGDGDGDDDDDSEQGADDEAHDVGSDNDTADAEGSSDASADSDEGAAEASAHVFVDTDDATGGDGVSEAASDAEELPTDEPDADFAAEGSADTESDSPSADDDDSHSQDSHGEDSNDEDSHGEDSNSDGDDSVDDDSADDDLADDDAADDVLDDDHDGDTPAEAAATDEDSPATTGPTAGAADLPLFSDDPKDPPLFSDDLNEHR